MNQKIHQLIASTNHLLKSKSRFRIHSPFVYNLITKCLSSDIPTEHATQLEKYRKEIYQTSPFFSTDLGSGKNRMMDGKALQKMSVSKNNGRILYNLSRYFRPNHILELGTSAGLSAAYLAAASPDASLITIEGCPQKAKLAARHLQQYAFPNLRVINADALKQLTKLQHEQYQADIIFIDANHTYQGTMDFFNLLLPLTHEDSIIIVDDIFWSKAMTRAWNHLTARQEVHLSVATMQFGLLFFKSGIQKQYFRLRF
ncbi:MAG: class I SAM-dependent methyltransferase [Bacteroidales bacterium]